MAIDTTIMDTTTRTDDFDEPTLALPRETFAELMSKIGGYVQTPPTRHENFYTELASTQTLPAVETESE